MKEMKYLKIFEEFNADDYLDAINSGGRIYWDEKEKLFLGQKLGLDRARHLSAEQSKVVKALPDAILFIDGEKTLIPYYVDGDSMNGGCFRREGDKIAYSEWSKDGLMKYGHEMVDSFDNVLSEIIGQLEDEGRPYIESGFAADEIDDWRMDKIMDFLIKKPNAFVGEFKERHGIKGNMSIADIAEHIIANDLWDQVEKEL